MNTEKLLALVPPQTLKNLQDITSILKDNGFECYLVGGSVRDLILGIVPDEYDMTTSAHPEDIKRLFRKVIETGIQHGTVTVLFRGEPFEITTFRKDIDYVDGRRPENVEFGVSLSEDLERRDFTMNAIALDVLSFTMVDEHNGTEDIMGRTIRTIGNPVDRFTEDGLRPVRAIRFMSTLGFEIEENTYKAISATRDVTARVSVERFHDELGKAFRSEAPSRALTHLFRNRIFRLFIHEPFEPPEKESDLVAIDRVAKDIPGMRLAMFFYIILRHQPDPVAETERVMRALRFSRQNTGDTLLFLKLLEKSGNVMSLSDYEFRRDILFEVASCRSGLTRQQILDGFYAVVSEELGINPADLAKKTEAVLQSSNGLTRGDLAINGRDIQRDFPALKGKDMGDAIDTCLEEVWRNPEMNTREKLNGLIQGLLDNPVK